MSEHKISLEDILEEYPADRKKVTIDEPEEIQKVIESVVTETEEAENLPTITGSSGKKVEFDETLRSRNPADEFKPSDIRKVTVREVETISDAFSSYGRSRRRNVAYEVPIEQDDEPKIRRMADSTRAREIAEQKKKKKRKSIIKSAYKKESPIGEYAKEPLRFRSKKAESKKTESVSNSEIEKKVSKKHKKLNNEETVFKYSEKRDIGKSVSKLKQVMEMRTLILTVTSLLSFFVTIVRQFNKSSSILTENDYLFLAIQLVLGLLSLIVAGGTIVRGLKNLFKLKPDTDSMVTVAFLSCVISILPNFFNTEMLNTNMVQIYMPVGIFALLVNTWGKKLILKRTSRNYHFISKCGDCHGVVFVSNEDRAEKLTFGTLNDLPILSAMRKTDSLTDFLKYSYSSDIADSYCRKALPVCLGVSVILGVATAFLRTGTILSSESAVFGFWVYSMLMCVSSCVGLPLVANVPLDMISQKTIRNRGVMLGYQSVDDFYDTNSVLISADTLFPEGTVTPVSVKIFSNTRTNEALLEAASLAYHANSIMLQLFDDIVRENYGVLYKVENFSEEENMGYCGWIRNKRVLMGNRDLMVSHSIEGLPSKSKEAEYATGNQEIIYLSISGNISAMFVAELRADKKVKKWAKRLCKEKVCMIIKSIDPCLNVKKISKLFDIPQDMIRVIPKRLFKDYNEETKKTEKLSASMACTGKFVSVAQLLTGTKIVHSSAITGLIFNTVSVIFGIIMCLLMIASKAFEENYIFMSAFAITLYNLICTAVTYIVVTLKKF